MRLSLVCVVFFLFAVVLSKANGTSFDARMREIQINFIPIAHSPSNFLFLQLRSSWSDWALLTKCPVCPSLLLLRSFQL